MLRKIARLVGSIIFSFATRPKLMVFRNFEFEFLTIAEVVDPNFLFIK